MALSFNEGDVVNRITGGPLMTVEVIVGSLGNGFVACVWFNVNGEVQRDSFAACTLRKWVNVTHEIG